MKNLLKAFTVAGSVILGVNACSDKPELEACAELKGKGGTAIGYEDGSYRINNHWKAIAEKNICVTAQDPQKIVPLLPSAEFLNKYQPG